MATIAPGVGRTESLAPRSLAELIERGPFERYLRETLTWSLVSRFLVDAQRHADDERQAAEFDHWHERYRALFSRAADEVLQTVSQEMLDHLSVLEKRAAFNANYVAIGERIRTLLQARPDADEIQRLPNVGPLLTIRLYGEMFDLGIVLLYYFASEVENIHIVDERVTVYTSDGRAWLSMIDAAADGRALKDRGAQFAQISGGGVPQRFDPVHHAPNLTSPYGIRMALRQRTTRSGEFLAALRLHHATNITFDALIEQGVLSEEAGLMLAQAVRAAVPILIAGAPGSGKTTLLRALTKFIPRAEPVLVAENYEELHLEELVDDRGRPWFYVLHSHVEQEANAEGAGSVTMKTILERGLQEDVRRLVIGEVTDPETMEVLLQAANTGTSGVLATIHAESALDTVNRVFGLLLRTTRYTDRAAAYLIESTLNLVVHCALVRNEQSRRRVVTGIGWVVPHPGQVGGMPRMQMAFVREGSALVRAVDHANVAHRLEELVARRRS
ncbi:type II secretion system protein E [Acidimicrobium ferrooxidans DSM 10331]|uniref:Type II secretion system protein E n=1 Tax=Acidimicrobium ferrooxidans (strain DSM 10331 / JCM 15462 / NBRC 103882 / ICP) TaxID=525909 RepID=C7M121_ACIFD|nr:ATPase, T2SS/T4P/T4SS family [Acidimicrobium ferrooxidans]ACU52983.1 type II secretion system protein E [Acidimicrobium ferrooxidans DSM 10331]